MGLNILTWILLPPPVWMRAGIDGRLHAHDRDSAGREANLQDGSHVPVGSPAVPDPGGSTGWFPSRLVNMRFAVIGLRTQDGTPRAKSYLIHDKAGGDEGRDRDGSHQTQRADQRTDHLLRNEL